MLVRRSTVAVSRSTACANNPATRSGSEDPVSYRSLCRGFVDQVEAESVPEVSERLGVAMVPTFVFLKVWWHTLNGYSGAISTTLLLWFVVGCIIVRLMVHFGVAVALHSC